MQSFYLKTVKLKSKFPKKRLDKSNKSVYNTACKGNYFTGGSLKSVKVKELNEKRSEISLLYDYYSPLLSERQRDVLDLYYNDDLSLSEIAENCGITRQGVRDAVVKGEEYLYYLEGSLGLAKREHEIREIALKIMSLTADEKVRREANKLIGEG